VKPKRARVSERERRGQVGAGGVRRDLCVVFGVVLGQDGEEREREVLATSDRP
jgi:hypothetical protein